MKNISVKIILLVAILFTLGTAGFYFKDDIYGFVKGILKYSSEVQKIHFDDLTKEIEKQVYLPSPLRVENNGEGAFLTKEGIISETNKYRIENGLNALEENAELNSAAFKKAEDMFNNQYFDHISPSGVGPDQVVLSSGYEYILTGENLLLGNFSSDKEAVEAWINSPPHRENMLTPRYTDIGVAVVSGTFEGQNVWIGVQEFGLPSSACPEPDVFLKQRIDLYETEINNLSAAIQNKKAEIESYKKKNSEEYNAKVNEYNELVEEYNYKSDLLKQAISDYNNQVNEFNNCIVSE